MRARQFVVLLCLLALLFAVLSPASSVDLAATLVPFCILCGLAILLRCLLPACEQILAAPVVLRLVSPRAPPVA
jgi:hypothetical protein